MMRRKFVAVVVTLAAATAGACGDDSNGGGGGGSYNAIQGSIDRPTGTVDQTSAPLIAEEYEKISGIDDPADKQSQTIACDESGNISFSAGGGQNSSSVEGRYNNCCQDDCCLNGSYTFYYASTSGSSFGYCGDWDITAACSGEASFRQRYEGCFGEDGSWTYVVRVGGETYSVTGYYSGGNGELEIRGANGSFTCTYTDGSGSCTGDGDFSF